MTRQMFTLAHYAKIDRADAFTRWTFRGIQLGGLLVGSMTMVRFGVKMWETWEDDPAVKQRAQRVEETVSAVTGRLPLLWGTGLAVALLALGSDATRREFLYAYNTLFAQ